MSAIERPRAVLFDWDNTLVDSWAIIHDAMNVTLETFGHAPWSLEETRARVARSMRDSFPDLFGDDWEKASTIFYDHFENIHMDRLSPLPGASEMLADLCDAGFYLAVVSNKRGDILRRESTHLGWDRFFGHLIGAGDADRDKPAPDPIHLALNGSGTPAGDGVWYVGDGAIDLAAAVAAGCVAVLVRPDPLKDGEFTDPPPALHVSGCKALSKVLIRL